MSKSCFFCLDWTRGEKLDVVFRVFFKKAKLQVKKKKVKKRFSVETSIYLLQNILKKIGLNAY